MELKEKLLRRKKVYTGRVIDVSNDEVLLPDGKKANREFMEHPGAVAVLAFLDTDRIVLVRQYRFPVREITYELPAGKLDKKEDLAACVRRELEEETGFYAKRVNKILSYWPTPAFSNEIIHLYEARSLVPTQHHPDDDEFIERKIISFRQAKQMVKSGRIRDSKTLIALLWWENRLKNR